MRAETPLGAYAPEHPAFEGHFPGDPMVPGVLLLDAALHALCEATRDAPGGWRLDRVKFHAVVRPGAALAVHGEPGASGGFSLHQGGRVVATGSLAPLETGAEGP